MSKNESQVTITQEFQNNTKLTRTICGQVILEGMKAKKNLNQKRTSVEKMLSNTQMDIVRRKIESYPINHQ